MRRRITEPLDFRFSHYARRDRIGFRRAVLSLRAARACSRTGFAACWDPGTPPRSTKPTRLRRYPAVTRRQPWQIGAALALFSLVALINFWSDSEIELASGEPLPAVSALATTGFYTLMLWLPFRLARTHALLPGA